MHVQLRPKKIIMHGNKLLIASGPFQGISAINGNDHSITLSAFEGNAKFTGVEWVDCLMIWMGEVSLWEHPSENGISKRYEIVGAEYTATIIARSVKIWIAPKHESEM